MTIDPSTVVTAFVALVITLACFVADSAIKRGGTK
jgi:hypothetical protein